MRAIAIWAVVFVLAMVGCRSEETAPRWATPACGAGEEHESEEHEGETTTTTTAPSVDSEEEGEEEQPAPSPEPTPESPAPCDPSKALCSCTMSGECAEGQACIGGKCIEPCETQEDCAQVTNLTTVCVDGACRGPVCWGTGQRTCGEGMQCGAPPFAGVEWGLCEPDPIAPECDDAVPCTGRRACVEGTCRARCEEHADCPEGFACDGAAGACVIDPRRVRPCQETGCTAPRTCGADGRCGWQCSENFNPCSASLDVYGVGAEISCHEAAGQCRSTIECDGSAPCEAGQACVNGACLSLASSGASEQP